MLRHLPKFSISAYNIGTSTVHDPILKPANLPDFLAAARNSAYCPLEERRCLITIAGVEKALGQQVDELSGEKMYSDRIRLKSLLDKVVSAEEAARFINNGMTIGMSGFTRAGEAKAVPLALAERAAHQELKITLMTGASLGNDLDKILTQAWVLARRLPFQSDPVLRRAINAGEVMFIDQHLSETVELLRSRQIGPIDIAVLESVAITAEGGIIPTTSIGNSATFGILAEKVIIEINLNQPLAL